MSLYGDMQALAGNLLTEFNQGTLAIGVYTPGGGPAHDPDPPTYPETTFKGAVRGVSAQHLADTLIQSSDLIVTMPGGGVVPKPADRILINGAYHAIVKIEPKPASGTVVAYRIFVRK